MIIQEATQIIMSFMKKVVIITGASSGIGAATAVQFAKAGASLVLTARNEANLKKVEDICKHLEVDTLTVKADLNKDDELKTIVQKAMDKFNKIDVLVNNAGMYKTASVLDENTVNVFEDIIRNNLRSMVYLTGLATPFLVMSKGNIVNVSSVTGTSLIGNPAHTLYGISKAGIDIFIKGIALELAPSGVRANCVSPGPVRTDIYKKTGSKKTWDELRIPLKVDRVPNPEEIAELIMYLASEKAKSVTGANYIIDNGTLLKN